MQQVVFICYLYQSINYMKKLLTLILPLGLLLMNCNKEKLTPDGKPQSDASKNIVRIDASAEASYWLSVASYDKDKVGTGTGTENAAFYQLKNDLKTPYECVFTAIPGQVVFIEVYTTGQSVSCDIYYKGVKVTNANADIFNSHSSTAPSHANITYEVGK